MVAGSESVLFVGDLECEPSFRPPLIFHISLDMKFQTFIVISWISLERGLLEGVIMHMMGIKHVCVLLDSSST